VAQWTTNYNGLVSLLETYCDDTSAEYVSAVQGCINRAEERLLKDLDLASFNTTTTTSTVPGQIYISRPYSDTPTLTVFATATGIPLEPRSYDYIRMYGGSGLPQYFAEDKDNLYFAPVPDNAYALTLKYMLRPTALSASNTSNWLTENAADALLYGALIESESFLISPERVQEFTQRYASLVVPIRSAWKLQSQQSSYAPLDPTPTPHETR
jgi:hypothetical protein